MEGQKEGSAVSKEAKMERNVEEVKVEEEFKVSKDENTEVEYMYLNLLLRVKCTYEYLFMCQGLMIVL